MSEGSESGMVIRLSPQAARETRNLSDQYGCDPTELVRIGLGLMNLLHDTLKKGLKMAVVNEDGKPLREVVLPEMKGPRQSSIDRTVQQILENSYHSSSLELAISDLDPDNPNLKDDTGKGDLMRDQE